MTTSEKESSLKTNDNSETASEVSTIKDSGIETQATDLLDGFSDFFDEEWSYNKDSEQTIDDLFQEDWTYGDIATVDFNIPQRCVIIDIFWDKSDVTLTVKELKNEIIATVKCFGIW